MQLILTLILLTTLISSALSFNITCRYTTRQSEYTCLVSKIAFSSPLDTTVTAVEGRHQKDKTAADVKVFEARGKNLKRFPFDLNKFFPNLEDISIERSLTEIHKEELGEFPNLKKLFLAFNEISVIKADLFANNPNLELIYLGNNKITTVAPKVFDGLTKLAHLGFERNKCFNAKIQNTRENVVKTVQQIYEKCSAVTTTTTTTVAAGSSTTVSGSTGVSSSTTDASSSSSTVSTASTTTSTTQSTTVAG